MSVVNIPQKPSATCSKRVTTCVTFSSNLGRGLNLGLQLE